MKGPRFSVAQKSQGIGVRTDHPTNMEISRPAASDGRLKPILNRLKSLNMGARQPATGLIAGVLVRVRHHLCLNSVELPFGLKKVSVMLEGIMWAKREPRCCM